MGQQDLFGKPVEREVEEVEEEGGLDDSDDVEEDYEEDETIADDNEEAFEDKRDHINWKGEKEFQEDWVEPKVTPEMKKFGYKAYQIQLMTASTFEGLKKMIDSDCNDVGPDGEWCGYWSGNEDFEEEKDVKVGFDNIMKSKLEDQKNSTYKYIEPKEEDERVSYDIPTFDGGHFYREIPLKNYIVNITDKAKEFCKEQGFDFDAWYKEYQAIEEIPESEEHADKVFQTEQTIKEAAKVMKDVRAIKDSVKIKVGIRESYSDKKKKLDPYPEQTVDALLKLLDEKKEQARKLQEKLGTLWPDDDYYGKRKIEWERIREFGY